MVGRGSSGSGLVIIVAALIQVSTGCSEVPPASPATPPSESATPLAIPTAGDRLVPDTRPSPNLQWADATVPEGRVMRVVLAQRLSSTSSRSGTIFQSRLTEPVRAGSQVVLPEGSIFEGFIGEVTPAARGGEQGGSIELRFRLVKTPVGTGASVDLDLTEVAGANVVGRSTVSAGERGRELELDEGTECTIVLAQPLDIKVRQ